MPRYKISVIDPKLNEYLYNRLSGITNKERANLDASELKLLSSPKELRQFLTWGTFEKKLAICTKVNIPFFLVIYDEPEKVNDMIGKVYKQHRFKGVTIRNIEGLRDENIFVMGNKDVAISLSLLAQNCHSDVYYLNKDFKMFHRIAHHAVKSQGNLPKIVDYDQSVEALRELSKFAFQAKLAENYIMSIGLQPLDAMILFYLFPLYQKYVKVDDIQLALDGVYKANSVFRNCWELFENEYIDKLPTESRRPAYTITAKGINATGSILMKITNGAVNK